MGKKLTTVRLTEPMRYIEDAIIKESGINKVIFHRLAYEQFIAGKHEIDEQFKIRKRNDPNYVSRSVIEQTCIDDEIRSQLEKIAEEQNVKFTTVLCQAISDYCVYKSSVLPQEMVSRLIQYNNHLVKSDGI